MWRFSYRSPPTQVKEAAGEHRIFAGGRWGFINRKGAIVVPLRIECAESFQNGRARVKLEGQWQYIDRKGRKP
jgi:hypothetical protein